jgi:hypothetical protein
MKKAQLPWSKLITFFAVSLPPMQTEGVGNTPVPAATVSDSFQKSLAIIDLQSC